MVKTRKMVSISAVTHSRVTRSSMKHQAMRSSASPVFKIASKNNSCKKALIKQIKKIDSNSQDQCSSKLHRQNSSPSVREEKLLKESTPEKLIQSSDGIEASFQYDNCGKDLIGVYKQEQEKDNTDVVNIKDGQNIVNQDLTLASEESMQMMTLGDQASCEEVHNQNGSVGMDRYLEERNQETVDNENTPQVQVMQRTENQREVIQDMDQQKVTLTLNPGLGSELLNEGGRLKCPYCDQVWNSFEEYANHLKSHNKEVTSGTMLHCKGSQMTRTLVHTNEKTFLCEVCGGTFGRNSALSSHMRKHRNERNHKCAKCHQKFLSNSCLRKHMRSKCFWGKLLCPECNKDFKTKVALQRHMLEKKCDKMFPCGECNLLFYSRSSFYRHKNATHILKTYMCLECHQTYPDMNAAKQHSLEVHERTADVAGNYIETRDTEFEKEDEEDFTEPEDDIEDPDYKPSEGSAEDDSSDEYESTSYGKKNRKDATVVTSNVDSPTDPNVENYLEAMKPVVIRKTLPLNASEVDKVLAKYPVIMPRPVLSKSCEVTVDTTGGDSSNKSRSVKDGEEKPFVVDQNSSGTDPSKISVSTLGDRKQQLKDREMSYQRSTGNCETSDFRRPSVMVTVNGATCTLPLVVTEEEIIAKANSLKLQNDQVTKTSRATKSLPSAQNADKDISREKQSKNVQRESLKTIHRKRQQNKKNSGPLCGVSDSDNKTRSKSKSLVTKQALPVSKKTDKRKWKKRSALVLKSCSKTLFTDGSPRSRVENVLAKLPLLMPKPTFSFTPENSTSNPQQLSVPSGTTIGQLPVEQFPPSSTTTHGGTTERESQFRSSLIEENHIKRQHYRFTSHGMNEPSLRNSKQSSVREDNLNGVGCTATNHVTGDDIEASQTESAHLSVFLNSKPNESSTGKSHQLGTLSENTSIVEVCGYQTSENELQYVEPNSEDDLPCIITNVMSLNPTARGNTQKVMCESSVREDNNPWQIVTNLRESVAHNEVLPEKTSVNCETISGRDELRVQRNLDLDKTETSSSFQIASRKIGCNIPVTLHEDKRPVRTANNTKISSQSSQISQSVTANEENYVFKPVSASQQRSPSSFPKSTSSKPDKLPWDYHLRRDFTSYSKKIKFLRPFQIRQKKAKSRANAPKRYRPLLPKPSPVEEDLTISESLSLHDTHYGENVQRYPNSQTERSFEIPEAERCTHPCCRKNCGLFSAPSAFQINILSPCELVAGVSGSSDISCSEINNQRLSQARRESTFKPMPCSMKQNKDLTHHVPPDRNSRGFNSSPTSSGVNLGHPLTRTLENPHIHYSGVKIYHKGPKQPSEPVTHPQLHRVTSEYSTSSDTNMVSKVVAPQRYIILGDSAQPFRTKHGRRETTDISVEKKVSGDNTTTTSCFRQPLLSSNNREDQNSVFLSNNHVEKNDASVQVLSISADNHVMAFGSPECLSSQIPEDPSSFFKQPEVITGEPSVPQYGQHFVITRGYDSSRSKHTKHSTSESRSLKKQQVPVRLRSFVGSVDQETYSNYARKLGGRAMRTSLPNSTITQNVQEDKVSSLPPRAKQQTLSNLVSTSPPEGVLTTNKHRYETDPSTFNMVKATPNNRNTEPLRRYSGYSAHTDCMPNKPHPEGDLPGRFTIPGTFKSGKLQTVTMKRLQFSSTADGLECAAGCTTDTPNFNSVSRTENILSFPVEQKNTTTEADTHLSDFTNSSSDVFFKSEGHSSCPYSSYVAVPTVSVKSEPSAIVPGSNDCVTNEEEPAKTFVIRDLPRGIEVETKLKNRRNKGAFVPYTEHKENVETQAKINHDRERSNSVYRLLQRAIACVPLVIGSDGNFNL